jgi:hypothetical protein
MIGHDSNNYVSFAITVGGWLAARRLHFGDVYLAVARTEAKRPVDYSSGFAAPAGAIFRHARTQAE